ncbi:hypothetical protein CGRA01v4_09017 [Colletotrichum graminicola]|nr:hypothetical protein CGRA01v4_09017 [Colletotrichum graminicola]
MCVRRLCCVGGKDCLRPANQVNFHHPAGTIERTQKKPKGEKKEADENVAKKRTRGGVERLYRRM